MKTICVLSGGMDSAVLLYWLKAQGRELHALSVNYGQRHRVELECAAKLCTNLGVPHQIADLSGLKPLLGGSSQTSDDVAVPHGHYAEETMKLTVVPNRNMMLLSVAAAWAISLKADTIAYAAHAGDHAIYPDCRDEFIDAMDKALALADWHIVSIERPFVKRTKADIAGIGMTLGVPFADTYSCYEGRANGVHCGKCGTCTERREAFAVAGVPDPTIYLA